MAAKRTAYGYDIPFIIVRLGDGQSGGSYPYKSTVRAAQEWVCANVEGCYLVSADGLNTTDGSHYDAAGYDTLANRIFDVIEIIQDAEANTHFPYTFPFNLS